MSSLTLSTNHFIWSAICSMTTACRLSESARGTESVPLPARVPSVTATASPSSSLSVSSVSDCELSHMSGVTSAQEGRSQPGLACPRSTGVCAPSESFSSRSIKAESARLEREAIYPCPRFNYKSGQTTSCSSVEITEGNTFQILNNDL